MISAPQARKFWEAKMITILITLGGGGVWPMITIDYVRGWGGLESRNHDYVILKRSLTVMILLLLGVAPLGREYIWDD